MSIITAALSMTTLWCMLYGRLEPVAAAFLCVAAGAFPVVAGHGHTRLLGVDALAAKSRLNSANPSLKFWTALVLTALCVSSSGAAAGVFLTAAALSLTVWVGGVSLRDYAGILALPVSFLMVSGLALIIEVSPLPEGMLDAQVFGVWLCVNTHSQVRAALVTSRALGAVSCLYFLSLSTTMTELIGVLRRVRCPGILIDLMYLIYRYIFILTSMHRTMSAAAAGRLGFADYSAGLRTTGKLYCALLSRGYRQASVNFDAMESRCYDSDIRFLDRTKPVTPGCAAVAAGLTALTAFLSIFY